MHAVGALLHLQGVCDLHQAQGCQALSCDSGSMRDGKLALLCTNSASAYAQITLSLRMSTCLVRATWTKPKSCTAVHPYLHLEFHRPSLRRRVLLFCLRTWTWYADSDLLEVMTASWQGSGVPLARSKLHRSRSAASGCRPATARAEQNPRTRPQPSGPQPSASQHLRAACSAATGAPVTDCTGGRLVHRPFWRLMVLCTHCAQLCY